MGTGSSKSIAQTSLTMANTARLSSVNNVHDAGFLNEVNPDRNGEGKDFSVNSTSALALFSEKHPEIAPTLNTTKDHYHALKDAQNDGNLISLAAFQHVKGLYDVYIQDKSRKNRCALTEFAVALGIPKLAYEVIVDSRTKYQELTTWDREKDTEESKSELPVSTEEKKRFDFAVKYQTLATWDREKDTEGRKGELAVRTEEQESEQDKAKNDVLKMSQDITAQLVAALLNFTDVHDSFCLACNEAGMVPLFVEMIKELQDTIRLNLKFVNPQTQHLSRFTVRGKILSRALGILHNLSKRVPTRRNFAACQAVSVLVPLLKAEVALYSAKTLLILAYLIDEENNHLIMADEGPIKFLTSLLERSLKASSHRYIGFSSSELAEGLTQIAVNDSNKKTIAQCGAIPILIKMLQSAQDDEEKFNACNTLWTLAFDEENRQQIKNDNVVIPELKKLLASENSEIKRAAAGALWECEGKEKHAEEKQQSVKVQEAIGVHVQDTKHVMISYQWDVQTLVIQLKNRLQADGYKVWMDIDEMGGSTLESMAKAVENASVVLVCVSQKYKESPNCRSEAEYTFQLHKDIIPLMMESKYRPDGWLGFIVGSKFWIDFSEKHKLDMNANKLLKELGNRGKITVQEPIVQAVEEDVVDASPEFSIRSWSRSDVKSWIKDVGLEDRLNKKAVDRLDGRMLLRLQDLRKESPEFFYSSIKTDLGLSNVFDVLEFVDELDKLQG